MKMLKKLLAVVLTGAMALTLLTACGGNAVTEKDIADAMNDMAKAKGTNVTFTPRAAERELAQKLAALSEKEWNKTNGKLSEKVIEILGLNEANEESCFVWYGAVFADEIGVTGQAYNVMNNILSKDAVNADKLEGEPADIRYIGTALDTLTIYGKQTTVRIIVVTAPVKSQESQRPGKA